MIAKSNMVGDDQEVERIHVVLSVMFDNQRLRNTHNVPA